jgi:osmotically-inducible protein OsmY
VTPSGRKPAVTRPSLLALDLKQSAVEASPAESWRIMSPKVLLIVLGISLLAVPAATSQDLQDLRILDDVAATVNASPHFTIFDDVNVSVDTGVVTLSGKVTMGYKRDELQKRAAGVAGVRHVVDELTVLPASLFDDELRQQIARAIYGNSNFWHYAVMANPPIHIVVDRSRVTLTGVVRSEVDRRLAQALATQFGALSVTNDLKTDTELRGRVASK